MPHFKVSDDSHSHPKVIMAGDAAWGMWNRAGCFAMAYGYDGFVPDWWVKQQPQGRVKAKRLVEVELWHPGEYQGNRPEYQGQKGYNFHQWRQDSYEKIEADREKWRQKKAEQRASGGKSPPMSPGDNMGDSPRDEPGESPGESDRTPGYTHYPLDNSSLGTDVALGGGSGGNPQNAVAPSAPAARGHRLPADWMPDQQVIAQMRDECPSVDLEAEHRKFVDHWTDQPGAKGRRVDWNGTWRNWIRRESERYPTRKNGAHVATSDRRVAEVQSLKNRQPAHRLELE